MAIGIITIPQLVYGKPENYSIFKERPQRLSGVSAQRREGFRRELAGVPQVSKTVFEGCFYEIYVIFC